MQKEEFLAIVKKYQEGTASPEELEFLRTYYNLFETEPDVLEFLSAEHQDAIKNRIEGKLLQQITETPSEHKSRKYRWLAAAASVLFILSAGGYLTWQKQPARQLAQNQVHDISPGTTHAILKIGHGGTVILDNKGDGLIAKKGNTSINKTGNGSLAYSNSNPSSMEAVYDTLVVPAGSKPYHLDLADGSKILINAATTLRYPESFAGNKRPAIELVSGEAFFEIIHNEKAPLRIITPHETIEDIGTQFNISAYPDDTDSRTTLVEGAVKVTAGSTEKRLVPGQQAIYANSNIIIATANLEEALAWKNGYFRFYDETITGIMKQLARWYGIEVVYQGTVTQERFNAKISRYKKISSVLRVLERTKGVHFKIEGRRVTVLNKP